jgi:hypothetical protein
LTFKEDREYSVILDGLKFIEQRKCWTASYPFCESLIVLGDNYRQVKKFMEGLEQKLEKKGRVDEFNQQFYQTVERGVFRELTKEEIEDWDGPMNYISMVEALKNGPHATTPLRICMNSSLKQPPPVSKLLNVILMKGLSSLVGIFAVTLSMREHQYALTKDLSKFYQKVDADEVAQHVRRVLWR